MCFSSHTCTNILLEAIYVTFESLLIRPQYSFFAGYHFLLRSIDFHKTASVRQRLSSILMLLATYDKMDKTSKHDQPTAF
jgi:hypothetical protein